MLWKCPPAVIAPYIPQMLATVQWLVGCQDSAGNWPTKAPSFLNRDGENELVHPPAPPNSVPGEYLQWSAHLAHLTTTHASLVARGEMGVPDRPLSLYEGLAGMCCAWALVLWRISRQSPDRPEIEHEDGEDKVLRGGMPGYDDLECDVGL
ncbi:hypothetical protein BDZ94DRAFT_1263373 [Collybia nuda]|uniref:Uncharacterized protein n=1 Tax=Collybia nuda TaxID=64659 RepID=A0A9P5Y5A3_9AGAR|nr:hypothetical protein BDZ94DRAFT_1263373 [Collybia nuda]